MRRFVIREYRKEHRRRTNPGSLPDSAPGVKWFADAVFHRPWFNSATQVILFVLHLMMRGNLFSSLCLTSNSAMSADDLGMLHKVVEVVLHRTGVEIFSLELENCCMQVISACSINHVGVG